MGKRKPSEFIENIMPLTTLESCEARIPTGYDHDTGRVPSWCELTLTMEREGDATITHTLRRHDGELIIACLDEVLHPRRAKSQLDALWAKLDSCVDRLHVNPTKIDKGRAEALAYAIALMATPYDPDIDAVREQSVDRYVARHADED